MYLRSSDIILLIILIIMNGWPPASCWAEQGSQTDRTISLKKVDHNSRREEVAAAAAKLIAEQGMDGLTTRSLAKSMGCSIGVLSHYFNCKEDIVLAAFHWADTRIDKRMEDILTSSPTLDSFIPVIRAGLPLDAASDLEWRVRFNLYAYALTSSEHLPVQMEKLQLFRQQLETIIGRLQAANEIRSDVAAIDVTNLAFDLVIGTAQYLLMIALEDREQYVKSHFKLVELLRPGHLI
jgi:AcrR family transcriptional regulator